MELDAKCHTFGNADLAGRITASHPTGYSLASAIERDGAEQVLVMERQNDFCRFKVRSSTEEVKLSKMFALIEDVKTKIHIREYSVSQTTLEQIFNSFASQQEEEQGIARGVYQGD
ncbi:hypothetical protein BBJ29_009845 [Phytophthora kernoviae]|uniref:DUF4162 domain-containing protein n=1 Tax=Phytophthora kernoviae TaxID=325452 RepID=A0A3R7JIX3_9STRA|nr:hypothetical protein BBJ29_009845 [Phytophthora kernoviae]